MTTLLSHSSPELSGAGWTRVAFKYGPLGLIAVGAFWWLTQNADARLDAQALAITNLIAEQHETRALVEHHVDDMRTDQVMSRRLLYAICRGVNKSSREALELCEVSR